VREKQQVAPRILNHDQSRPQDENKGRSRLQETWSAPDVPASSAIGRAYERFLELPVPVVLVVLWLIGALFLGAVAMVAHSALVWLWSSAATAPP
jgi:hypothetical protein